MLLELYDAAGQPSTRSLGRDAGMSHTTVASLLNGTRNTTMNKLIGLFAALGGQFDPDWYDKNTVTSSSQELLTQQNQLLERIAVALELIAAGHSENVAVRPHSIMLSNDHIEGPE